MKIKFEIKLTASKALLAIMAGLIGLQQDAALVDKTEKPEFEPMPLKSEPIPAEQLAAAKPAETPAPEVTKKKRNTQKPAEQPAPEKIVPPAPEPEKEAEAEASVPETEAQQEETQEEPALTIDNIRNFAGKLLQEKPALREKVMAVLAKHGASKFSEANPKDYASILADFKTLA